MCIKHIKQVFYIIDDISFFSRTVYFFWTALIWFVRSWAQIGGSTQTEPPDSISWFYICLIPRIIKSQLVLLILPDIIIWYRQLFYIFIYFLRGKYFIRGDVGKIDQIFYSMAWLASKDFSKQAFSFGMENCEYMATAQCLLSMSLSLWYISTLLLVYCIHRVV